MAELVRLVNYSNLPRWDGYPGWLGTSNQPPLGCHPFPGTQASLCVNELARKKSTIDFAEVPQETWEQIVRSCVQIMPMLPGSHDVALPVGLHVDVGQNGRPRGPQMEMSSLVLTIQVLGYLILTHTHVLLRYGYTIGVSIYQPISPI